MTTSTSKAALGLDLVKRLERERLDKGRRQRGPREGPDCMEVQGQLGSVLHLRVLTTADLDGLAEPWGHGQSVPPGAALPASASRSPELGATVVLRPGLQLDPRRTCRALLSQETDL